MDKLPREIIDIIISYSYSPQPVELLEDIRDYYFSRKLVFRLYYNFFHLHMNENYIEHKNWFVNDLIFFINGNNSILLEYSEMFCNIFSRYIMVKNYENIDNYYMYIENTSIDTEINIVWGLLTPKERNNFIYYMFTQPEIKHTYNDVQISENTI